MSRTTSQYPERVYSSDEDLRRRGLSSRGGSGGRSNGLLIAGLAALGVGALAVYYFGPDVRRYLKMKSM